MRIITRYYFLIGLFILFLALAILILFNGLFEGKVKYLSCEFGNLDNPVSVDEVNDYTMFVTFESKGAFIAGRKIHISIDFIANREVDKFRKLELTVTFPGALEYPIRKNIRRLEETRIRLNFVNDTLAHGMKDIVYFMPELDLGTVSKSYYSAGKYTYRLLIDGKSKRESLSMRTNDYFYVAPLEIKLQVKNNNLILVLTIFAIYIAIAQILISIAKSGKGG